MIKQSVKRILGVILFGAILFVSLSWVSSFLDKTDVDEKYKQFFAEENNIDVIFMGTSHTYNTIMPQEIWNHWGIPSYNFGQSNCTIPITYYVLQMLDEYTDPSLVVIDLFGVFEYADIGNGKYRTDSRDQQRVQFDAFPLSSKKIEAVNDVFDDYEDRWDFLFKLAIYHNRWSEIGKANFEPRNIPQKGAAFVLGHHAIDEYLLETDGTAFDIPPIGKDYIERIIGYCSERGIRLLFTYLPYVFDQAGEDAAASFEKYFAKNPRENVGYLNLLENDIINYHTDIYTDASHLNYIGAAAVTEWIGGYIAENYPDTVHRDDPEYASWDEDYDEYVDYKISRFTAGDLYNNLQLLYGDDFTAELIEPCDSQLHERFISDTTLQNLTERLGDAIVCRVSDDPSAPYLTLKVTDRRTGEIVFETVIE